MGQFSIDNRNNGVKFKTCLLVVELKLKIIFCTLNIFNFSSAHEVIFSHLEFTFHIFGTVVKKYHLDF